MGLPAVLVLGKKGARDVADVVFDVGLTPIVRETMMATMKQLRGESPFAVVVAPDHGDEDVLELLLNVRDVDPRVRVFVVDSVDDRGWSQRPDIRANVYFVTLDELRHKLKPEVLDMKDSVRNRTVLSPGAPHEPRGKVKVDHDP